MTPKDEVTRSARTDVILYELNEVPWSIIDLYVEARPESNLASLISSGQSLTTIDEDSAELSPWRTWPTFHASMYTEDHNSFDLGQDPTTFSGETIWDLAERSGLSVGLFGPLQSWPPRQFAHGGFFVPDTFSKDAQAFPRSVESFQKFNLAMTRENNFSSDARLSLRAVAKSGFNLVRNGFTFRSAATIGVHLARERSDRRYKALRPAIQVIPSFDLYWRLHQRHKPRLSVFFTNHVASMMHRFWGDAVPGYADTYDYTPDEVYSGFIEQAMDLADRQFGRIQRYLADHPSTLLLIAGSMGQGPVRCRYQEQDLYFLKEPRRLLQELGLKDAKDGLAMYPRLALTFEEASEAEDALTALRSVVKDDLDPMFNDFMVKGRTLSFSIDNRGVRLETATLLRYRAAGAETDQHSCLADLGITVRPRVGGDNTAYHIPEGILLACGGGVHPEASRREVSILDVAPSILANLLRIPPGMSMRGDPTLFTELVLAESLPGGDEG
ncbi:MAG: hypothetical protein M3256_26940 [Actinomycetota bacterium]|nr:hypothetical protein [Actinomycetota bacterium]